MRIGDVCNPHVVLADANASLRGAALQMRNEHVGALIIAEREGGLLRPVGILTDRDIVIAVVAFPEARPEDIRVADAMSTELETAREDEGLFEVVQRMSERAVRRLPVVRVDGSLLGMVTLDDVLRVLSAELGQLAEGLRWGRMRERGRRAAVAAPP